MIKRTAAKAKNVVLFFLSVANAFNPLAYRVATQKTLRQSATRLFCLLLIITLATVVVMVPALYGTNGLSKMSRVAVKIDIATKSPIDARLLPLGNAKVFVNTTADAKAASKYDVVLTSNQLRSKPFLCFFREDVCDLLGIRQRSTSIREIDLSQNGGRTLAGIFILLLPGLVLLLYLLMAAKYVAIILVTSLISYAILKIARKSTGIPDTLKIATYAATVPIVLDFAALVTRNGPVSIHPALPVAAYLAMLTAALVINEQTNTDVM